MVLSSSGVSRLGVGKWVLLVEEFVTLAHKVNEYPIFSTIIRHNLQKLSKRRWLMAETFKETLFILNYEMNNTTTFVVVVIVAVVATPTLILNPQLAQAQEGKHYQGRGAGELNCPPPSAGEPASSPPGVELIRFNVDRSKGKLFGDWDILRNVTFETKAGDITGG